MVKNKPQYLVIHHSLTRKSPNPKTWEAVNKYHKTKFNFPSSLGLYIGYHYWIEDNGRIIQARLDTDPGAHCKEQNMNFKSLGVCMEGNFDIEKPEDVQIFALRDLMKKLCATYKIPKNKIMFHRDYATYKSCPGKLMDRNFIRNLVK